jgi:hypothetical protein
MTGSNGIPRPRGARWWCTPRREEPARFVADPLVQRAQAGNLDAFELLLERRLTSLMRLALAIIGDDVDARDAVQQACVHAWRELPRLPEVLPWSRSRASGCPHATATCFSGSIR